jgi:hypothetical protein
MIQGVKEVSRRLRDLCEPIAGSVYFLPEAHAAYSELGLPGFAEGYFPSRGACLGRPSAEVIVAAFGVFNPDIVHPAMEKGWSVTDPPTILAARERGATEGLRRILSGSWGDADVEPATKILRDVMESVDYAGRALFSGLRSLPFPDDPFAALWRACDYVRERRGDGHVAAWVSHACDPVEISLLTELAWGLQLRTYVFTRGWTSEQVEAGIERLKDKGFLDADETLSDAGRDYRRSIEDATDRGEAVVVEGLGDRAEELFELLAPFQRAVLDAKGYPVDPGATMNNAVL